MQTLKELLNDWTEPEDAAGFLAGLLGVIAYDGDIKDYFSKNKIGVFYTDNKTSTMIYQMLEQMVEIGFLEKQDEWAYRWNSSFKGYWENGTDGR